MKISKIRNVLTPSRGTKLSAGIDFYMPKFEESFIIDLLSKNPNIELFDENIKLLPNNRILIPSGIRTNFQGDDRALIAFNKSGISTKKGLDVLACVIDQDYQGEIHISLVNTSSDILYISENEKIVQFILIPIFYDDVIEVDDCELWNKKTERGDGGFGHTDK